MTQPLRREPLRTLAAFLGVLSICLSGMLGLSAATASANPTLDAETRIDCEPDQTYDEDDAGLAEDLDDDGYTCTALLNKGPLGNDDIDKVGELWFKVDGGVLEMRTIIFGADNGDYSEAAKLCLDDDTAPINDVQAGGDDAPTCLGSDGETAVDHGASGGPSYPPAPEADASETDGDDFELRIDDLVEVGGDPGGWDVDIDGYTEAVLHFNQDDLSIVALFQPVPSDEPDEVTPAEPTFTDPCGTDGTITITPTEGVKYFNGATEITTTTVAIAEGQSITITAQPASDDYVLTGTTSWPFTNVEEETCGDGQDRTVEPAAPTQDVNTACGVEDTFTIPTTAGVTYLVDGVETDAGTYDLGDGDTVVITVVLDDDLVLAEGADDEWTFTGSDVQGCSRGNSSSRNPTTTTTTPVLAFTPDAEVSPEVIVAPAEPELAFTPEVENAAPAPELPFTGSGSETLTIWAAAFLGLGALLILGSRKRATA